jgi:hypothetical protein
MLGRLGKASAAPHRRSSKHGPAKPGKKKGPRKGGTKRKR